MAVYGIFVITDALPIGAGRELVGAIWGLQILLFSFAMIIVLLMVGFCRPYISDAAFGESEFDPHLSRRYTCWLLIQVAAVIGAILSPEIGNGWTAMGALLISLMIGTASILRIRSIVHSVGDCNAARTLFPDSETRVASEIERAMFIPGLSQEWDIPEHIGRVEIALQFADAARQRATFMRLTGRTMELFGGGFLVLSIMWYSSQQSPALIGGD